MTLTQRFERRPAFLFAIFSFCWVLLLYWTAFSAPFVYDDLTKIQQNPTIASLHSALAYFRTAVPFSGDFLGPSGSYYRPLSWMTLALDHALWGLWAPGYHLTNILLHWLNGFFGFLLLRRSSVPLLPAAGTCLLWLALPVNSEVVIWISARDHSLAFFFLLLALLCCCRYLDTRQTFALLCYFCAGLCALLSHELGILLLPFTVIVIIARSGWNARISVRLLACALLAVVIYAGMRSRAGSNLSGPLQSVWPLGISYLRYIGWCLFPLRMSLERSTDTPPATFSAVSALALLAIAALAALIIVLRRKAPAISAGLAWYCVALLPVSGLIFLYQGLAERYDYMASAGLVFAAVAAFRYLPKPSLQKVFAAALLLWTVSSVARLYARLGDWSTEERLYTASLAATPRSWVLLLNLGNTYLQRDDLPKAVQTYRHTLEVNPNASKAMVNLGAALEIQGDLPAAEEQFRHALQLDPNRAGIYSNLATVVYAQGRSHEAAALFRKAIELNPRDATSYFNLGILYAHSGLNQIAAQLYGQALQIDPDYPDAKRALALLSNK